MTETGENRAGNREQRYATSPLNGAKIPLGAHAKNTGGKKGRSGRRPDELREMLRAIVERKGIPLLRRIVAGKLNNATPPDQLRALELALRYGLDARTQQAMDVADVRDRLQRSLDEIRRLCPGEPGQAISDALRPLWQGTPR